MKRSDRIPAREITPPEAYFNRRSLLRAAVLAGSVGATTLAYRQIFRAGNPVSNPAAELEPLPGYAPATDFTRGFTVDEPKTSHHDVTHYNNFYEFTTDAASVARVASKFVSKPWQVEINGLVRKPRTYDLDDLRKLSPLEERVYRMRCVEGWSMVIPWIGYPLAALLQAVEPLNDAKYVAFQTLHDPARMPGQKRRVLEWPYVEGLRMDEAMHPLTLLAHGLYGYELAPQNGAPLRLVVPWKYGFKGIKSIVKITLLKNRPPTSWNLSAPREYGFYANVNPEVPHPRWSQADERRVPDFNRRPTLMFNGYADQVANLYSGMDLQREY